MQPVFGRVDHQLVHLFLLVVGNADIFERAVGVAPGHREAGEDGIHEELDDAAAQPVGDIVGQECAAGCRFRRSEKAVPAAHLVDHDRQLAPLVRDSVDLGALRHHHRVAHAGHTVREVPQRVLLHQLRHRLGAEPVDVRPHRCPMHGIAGPLPEHPGRLAAGIAQDFAAARIRRLPRNPAQRHRRRVRVAGVVGGIHHADRIVGRGLVQLAAPQRGAQLAPPAAVAQPPNPLPVGRAGRRGSDRFEHAVLAGQRRHPAIHRARLKGGHRKVVVRVAEAGNQRPPQQVHMRRLRAHRLTRLLALAHRHNPPVAHRNARGDAVQPVHSEHAPTSKEQLHHRLPPQPQHALRARDPLPRKASGAQRRSGNAH